ncbi:phage tail assembly protein [Paenibacillus campinasensis]|uniref:Phage tail assembly protein n=1 Tax=Paenibacillus campinasensis TaxID=66347 RepID=A0A268ELB5_9BACL|nr:phage tail assembly protein [Paenibacillus campinasensis]PAD73912.1 hypothetical protein CHH67_18940 [Paenibacillus campinasensis]
MSDKVVNVENLEEVQSAGTVVKLSRPFVWEDETYTEFNLDFGKLSGEDILKVEGEFINFIRGQKNVFVAFKTEHPAYHAVVAARAAGIDANMLKHLPAKDFLRVTGAAKDFLSSLD